MPGELISREALDRILQRAAELQAGEHDIGEGLTEGELLALGKDVGIPARYLRQALLEERTRIVAAVPAGLMAWLVGPAQLAAARVVPGDRAVVERALTRWMEDEELLQVKRRFPDSTSWEPKRGAFASIQRALGAGGKSYALAHAGEVAGQVTQLEPGFCHVQLTADNHRARSVRIQGAALLGSLGVAAAAAAIPLGFLMPWALLPFPILAVAGVTLLRRHGPENERIQVALEQVLDRLEHGEVRPEHALPGPRESAFVRIAVELRKTFR
ncbi:MAG TPA: hypothetical protein VEO73_12640 [Gemmatimonadales bacterium]|nr:hypothetical protein [Gemmatimonadales bacterium]